MCADSNECKDVSQCAVCVAETPCQVSETLSQVSVAVRGAETLSYSTCLYLFVVLKPSLKTLSPVLNLHLKSPALSVVLKLSLKSLCLFVVLTLSLKSLLLC